MKLAIKEFGKGGTKGDVILIHGTGAKAEMWNPQIELLVKNGWHCFVPDLRGHGESAEPEERTDLQAHMQDIFDTLADYDVKWPAIWVGHSLGSILSLEIASVKPEMVSKILAVSFPGKVPMVVATAFKMFLNLPYQNLRNTVIHRNLGWRERVLLDTNSYSLGQVVQNFHNLDYINNIPKVSCPVHFAVGRFDPVAPCMHVESIHKGIPGSTLQVIEWAGHNPMDSQPVAFNKWFKEAMNLETQ